MLRVLLGYCVFLVGVRNNKQYFGKILFIRQSQISRFLSNYYYSLYNYYNYYYSMNYTC